MPRRRAHWGNGAKRLERGLGEYIELPRRPEFVSQPFEFFLDPDALFVVQHL
jgi:hypothetical protein